MTTRNVLSQREFYSLCLWVEANKETLDSLNYTEIAIEASNHLNRPLTYNQVSRACKAIGWTPKGRGHKESPGDPEFARHIWLMAQVLERFTRDSKQHSDAQRVHEYFRTYARALLRGTE